MISIVIPTRNEEKIIEQTLSSLKRLTIPHEIIISDGHSTDNTLEIAKRYADKIINQDLNRPKTIAEGRNEGAAASTGEFIVFFDADCSIKDPNQFFTTALAYFASHPKTVALAARLKVLPEMSNWMDKIVFAGVNITYSFFNNILGIGAASTEFMMVRKETFHNVGGFKATLVAAEDINFFYSISRLGRTHLLRSLIVYHTGRRAHKVGWPKLLWEWFTNTVSLIFFKKAASKEWTVIR